MKPYKSIRTDTIIISAVTDTKDETIFLKRFAFILGNTLIPTKVPKNRGGKRIATLVKRPVVTIPKDEKAPILMMPMKRK